MQVGSELGGHLARLLGDDLLADAPEGSGEHHVAIDADARACRQVTQYDRVLRAHVADGAADAPARSPDVAKSPSAGVTDQRMRELHTRLSDAKKQLNDPRSVSLDGLTKQLRQAEDSLRKQHGNRKIDFDVVIKDGKAVVKPILK